MNAQSSPEWACKGILITAGQPGYGRVWASDSHFSNYGHSLLEISLGGCQHAQSDQTPSDLRFLGQP